MNFQLPSICLSLSILFEKNEKKIVLKNRVPRIGPGPDWVQILGLTSNRVWDRFQILGPDSDSGSEKTNRVPGPTHPYTRNSLLAIASSPNKSSLESKARTSKALDFSQ